MTEQRSIQTPSGEIQLRLLESVTEMQQLVDLQREIWGYGLPDTDYPYPARCLFALSESGGTVVAAFFRNQAVGFSVAWLGVDKLSGKRYLHSQLVGILPDFRHLSIGYHLKIYQREFAQSRGLELVRWTFDPLQSANANLNLRKLGAVVTTYRPHYYGELQSFFSNGLATDRVWADWYIDSARVANRLQAIPPLLDAEPSVPRVVDFNVDGPELLVEIPDDFDAIRKTDITLALEWQNKIRKTFQHYLSRGYVVSDFVMVQGTPRHGYYSFSKRSLHDLLSE